MTLIFPIQDCFNTLTMIKHFGNILLNIQEYSPDIRQILSKLFKFSMLMTDKIKTKY